ncbi:hypothetical protein RFI_25149, partial [Reticulomyxa filosa]
SRQGFVIVLHDKNAKIRTCICVDPRQTTLKQAFEKLSGQVRMQKKVLDGCEECTEFELIGSECVPALGENTFQKHADTQLEAFYSHECNVSDCIVEWTIHSKWHAPRRLMLPVRYRQQIVDTRPCYKAKENKFSGTTCCAPFLYERDSDETYKLESTNVLLRYVKEIEPAFFIPSVDILKALLHEIIKNGYLNDLTDYVSTNKHKIERKNAEIKKEIQYEQNRYETLVLNEERLNILGNIKRLYFCKEHEQMNFPLQPYHICALLLYCGRSCNVEFGRDQLQRKYKKWKWLDWCLSEAIELLSKYEKKQDCDFYLYCGLNEVRLQDVSAIKEGYFINYISTSCDRQVAEFYRGECGCILQFHPSMRTSPHIRSCNVKWISPYKAENETLFSRSRGKDPLHVADAWTATIISEDIHTQIVELRCDAM